MYAHLHKLSVDFTMPRQASSIRPAGPTPSPGPEQNGIAQVPLHPRRGQPALVTAAAESARRCRQAPVRRQRFVSTEIRLPTSSTFPQYLRNAAMQIWNKIAYVAAA
ncbi:hypothetical protein NKJ90_32985 [Mesorhizobium sp. M0051]|uniref:hypothetical protein n=1 Tax=Mesorhizobium sp. M0051 TaxID=2956862 RepID=UPI00333AD6F9